MDQPEPKQKLVTPLSLVVDAILVIGFFFYIYSVVSTHVPSYDPKMIHIFGGLCASCMTGVFWLALQMFRTVLRFQLSQKKK